MQSCPKLCILSAVQDSVWQLCPLLARVSVGSSGAPLFHGHPPGAATAASGLPQGLSPPGAATPPSSLPQAGKARIKYSKRLGISSAKGVAAPCWERPYLKV